MSLRNKLFGAAVAASMITGAVIPAMAASITIQNPVTDSEGQAVTYTAYKIFDVVHSGDGYAYTINVNSPWKAVVDNYIADGDSNVGQAANRGITLSDAPGNSTIKVVEFTNTEFDVSEFAKYLKEKTPTSELTGDYSGKTGNVDTNSGKYLINDLDDGYYLVSTANGTLAELITSASNVEIADKNAQSLTKTIVSDNSTFAAVGDEITYRIKTTVPYVTYAPNGNYQLVVTDNLPDSLTFPAASGNNHGVTVKIGNHNDGPTYSVDVSEKDNSKYVEGSSAEPEKIADTFTVTIDIPSNNTYKVGEEVVIEYKAKVNNNFTVIETNAQTNNGETNTATATVNGLDLSDTATFYTASVQIVKVDATNDNTKLSGAVFTLKNESNKYYSVSNGQISWVDSQTSLDAMNKDYQGNLLSTGTNFVTDSKGNIKFDGLDADVDYTLTEIKAPDGYNLMKDTETIDFKLNNQDFSEANASSLVVQSVSVKNNKGMQLPETGGMGTTLFYIAGGTMVAGAAVLLITKKRMSEAE